MTPPVVRWKCPLYRGRFSRRLHFDVRRPHVLDPDLVLRGSWFSSLGMLYVLTESTVQRAKELLRDSHEAEAYEVETDSRRGVSPTRRRGTIGRVAPGAAPANPGSTCSRTSWISHRAIRVIVLVVPILDPLPHIPVHVVQTPPVRLLRSHSMRRSARIPFT